MSSLINVGYAVNTSQYFSAMDAMADKSDTAMARAGAAADRWQAQVDAAAGRASGAASTLGGNFDAANDAIIKSAERSATAIEQIDQAIQQVDLQKWSSTVSRDMGRAFQEGTNQAKSWTESLVSWVESKLIIAGVAIAAGVAVSALTAVYAAYKIASGTINFVEGLFTGESYKSDSIDSLIATNDQVKQLQENLGLAAPRAQALGEALNGLGVDQGQYISTYEKANEAVRSNRDELDRLGVKYKDTQGNLLPLVDVQKNALGVIESYKEGWDRLQAAKSLGMGTERELQDALSATTEKVDAAQAKLIDYTMVIGDGTQEAVNAYQKAMTEFNAETELMSEGFKRAIADQVMPILTDLAGFFKEGFPFAVRAFRYSMATVASLFYGLKEAAYITGEAVIQSFGAIGDVVSRVASAIGLAVQGNFKGAVDLLMQTPDDLGKRWSGFMANVAAQSESNIKAMKLAWGFDNFNVAEQVAAHDAARNAGKDWVAAPKQEKAKNSPLHVIVDKDPNKALLDAQLKVYERAVQEENQLLGNREQMLKSYYDRGQISASEYYDTLEKIRTEAIDNVRADYDAEIALIQNYMDKYDVGSQQYIEASGKMAEARDKLTKAMQQNIFQGANTWLEQDARSAKSGFDRAMGSYIETTQNTGRQIETLFSNAFSGMEDALVNMVTKFKFSFSDLVTSIISDLARISIRQNITGPLATALQSTLGGYLSSPTSSGGGNAAQGLKLPSFDVGTDYVPKDMIAMVHEGEMIVPKAFNAAGGGVTGRQGVVINVVESPGNGGQVQQSQGAGGVDVITVLVERVKGAVANDISKSGGIAKVMEQRYGLSPAMGAVR